MNVDRILAAFNLHEVDYLLIGGINFLLRHAPVLTYDIDLWIEDSTQNRTRCEQAVAELQAEWGASDVDWGPVAARAPGWLGRQAVFCLTSPFGAIDVFRAVKGLDDWTVCREKAVPAATTSGVPFLGLADEDMLRCQLVLPDAEQDRERIEVLKRILERAHDVEPR